MLEDKEWYRLPYEPDKAYASFRYYLSLEPTNRRYEMVAEHLNCSYQNIARWGSEWRWRDRARTYDDYIVQHQDEKIIENVIGARDVLVQEELEDIVALREIWLTHLKTVKEMSSSIDPDVRAGALDQFNRLVTGRNNLSVLYRRAAKLPVTYRPDNSEAKETEGAVYVTDWETGPKLLEAPRERDEHGGREIQINFTGITSEPKDSS